MNHSSLSLETLAAQITESVVQRLNRDLQFSCCGDDMRRAIECGGERLSLRADLSSDAQEMAAYIDHTLLKPEATQAEIETLSAEAADYGFASVCVNPVWVREAHRILRCTDVAVCTVIGFPLGANASDVKAYEARRAIFDGAREVDMVISVGLLKSGAHERVERDIRAVVEVAHDAGALCKVIIETALLTDEEKVVACLLSKSAGADFVKTSTGFSKGGATAQDVALMRRVVGNEMGVKASGGVRDFLGAQEMIAAGATRIGASVGVKIVQGVDRPKENAAPGAGGY
jgi:deoxyribose-phosphate aldolase